jgi:hypothetical protein
MKIIDITLNGKTHQHPIPESWGDVNFNHFLKVERKFVKAVALFTGIEEATLKKAKINNLQVIVDALRFLETPVKEEELKIPEKILGYKVPKDLDKESIGQYADLQDAFGKFSKDIPIDNFNLYPGICAIFCIKPYDYEQAEALAPEFFNAPCTEVLAVVNFTYERLKELRNSKKTTSPPVATPPTKSKRATRG